MPFMLLLITDQRERIYKLAISLVGTSLANMDCTDHGGDDECTMLPNHYCYSNCASYRERGCAQLASLFCGKSVVVPSMLTGFKF